MVHRNLSVVDHQVSTLPFGEDYRGRVLQPASRSITRAERAAARLKEDLVEPYLDDLRDKRHNVGELAHVHVKMLQLITQGLFGDNLAPLSDGSQTSQVARRVQLGVGWARQVNLWYREW